MKAVWWLMPGLEIGTPLFHKLFIYVQRLAQHFLLGDVHFFLRFGDYFLCYIFTETTYVEQHMYHRNISLQRKEHGPV